MTFKIKEFLIGYEQIWNFQLIFYYVLLCMTLFYVLLCAEPFVYFIQNVKVLTCY